MKRRSQAPSVLLLPGGATSIGRRASGPTAELGYVPIPAWATGPTGRARGTHGGLKGSRAVLVNEAHALRKDVIRQLLMGRGLLLAAYRMCPLRRPPARPSTRVGTYPRLLQPALDQVRVGRHICGGFAGQASGMTARSESPTGVRLIAPQSMEPEQLGRIVVRAEVFRTAQRYPSAERWPPSPSTISSRLPSPGLRHSSRFAPSFRTTYRSRRCLIIVPSVQLSPFRPLAD